jgi:nicotinamide riboside kinase
MPKERSVKKLFKNIPEKVHWKGKKRWLDDTENDLKKMCVTDWRKTARGRDTWKLILKEAKVSHGPYSQCSRSKVVSNGQDGP